MFCQKCGRELPASSKQCPYCDNNKSRESPKTDLVYEFTKYIIFYAALMFCLVGSIAYLISIETEIPLSAYPVLAGSIIFFIIGFIIVKKYFDNGENEKTWVAIISIFILAIGLFLAGGNDRAKQSAENQKEIIKKLETGKYEYNQKGEVVKRSNAKTDYEGYINKGTFFCDDYETLIRLSDALQHKDNDLVGQLTLDGKIHRIDKDTKASIINTGALDKNTVSIVIEEGQYDLKSGYTFKDWTHKR